MKRNLVEVERRACDRLERRVMRQVRGVFAHESTLAYVLGAYDGRTSGDAVVNAVKAAFDRARGRK